jgi:phage shock protein B
MDEVLIPIMVVGMLFIGLPWLILHYVTKWKVNSSLTAEDENLLDELYDLARRLDDRMLTVERIMQADNPGWNAIGGDRAGQPRLEKAPLHELPPRRVDRLETGAEPVREPSRRARRASEERA